MGYVVLKINKMEKETPRLPNSLLAQSHNTSLLPPKTFVRIFKMCLNVCLYLESLHAYKNGLIAEFAYMTADLKLLHNHCLQFLLGHENVSSEVENNAYADFWGVKEVYYGICANSECATCSNSRT